MRAGSKASIRRSNPQHLVRRAAIEALETRRLLTVFTVISTLDHGPGTLREAIASSNLDTAGPNEIDFSLGGSGVQTIQLESNLPEITQTVTINGYSQPLATPNTLAVGDNANVLIHITGDSAGDVSTVLDLNAGHCVVEGLSLDNATTALVNIEDNQNFTTIKGNFLGTDTTDGPQPSEDDVDVSGADCLVGGSDPGSRNIVSGAGNFGINVQLGQDTVTGNYIGTDSTGTAALPNLNGISVQDGVDVISHNVISGNTQSGLVISEQTAPSVINNLIGTDATGAGPLGNQYGVYVNAMGSFAIGGNSPAQGNVIAYNSLVGVELQPPINGAISPVGVTIRYNSIFANGDSGINDGGAANDYQDGDTGANNQQNFPILASAVSNGTTTSIQAGLNSTPAQIFLLDFYSNPDTQADGFVQGKTYLGTSLVQTDGDGNAIVTATFNVPVPAGQYITATASDTAGAPYDNTSPFAQGVQVTSSVTGTPPPATDQPLTAIGAPSVSATEGASFSGVVAKFSDPDAGALVGDYSANITWGDTTSSAGVITKDPSGGFDVSGTHTYAEQGQYGVSVLITDTTGRNDTGGQTATATTTAIVADANLVATGGESLFATEGTAMPAQVLATFTDPGGSEALIDYSATINWGDGTSSAGVILSSNGSFEVAGSHTYAEETTVPGTVSITISHDTSTPQVVTDSIAVADANVVATGGYSIIAVEGAASGPQTVATFTDPAGHELLADYSATINWGDGSPSSAGSIAYAAGVFTVSGSHTYAEESSSPYVVKTTIFHDSSTAQNATSNATVSDPSVVATGGKTINAVEGATSSSQTVATFTDPGGAEAPGDYTATINWGDGSNATAGTISLSNGVFSVSGSHKYIEESAANSPYVVAVTIGHESSASKVVTSQAAVADPSIIPVSSGTGVTITEGQNTGAVQLAQFTDPGGAEPLADYSAKINWGDGSAATNASIAYISGKFVVTSPGHTYVEEGVYSPVITIYHDTSKPVPVTDVHRITVKDAPISGQGATLGGNEGRNISGTWASFADGYVLAPQSDFSASINWGDGSTSPGVVHSSSGGKFYVTGVHAYAEESATAYAVKVTVHDVGGATMVFNSLANVAPSPLDSAVGQTVTQPVNVAFTNKIIGSFHDQDAINTSPEDYNITINWGDGTTSAGTAILTGSAANLASYWNVLGSHKYTTTGIKTVKISVIDDATTGPALTITSTIKVV